MYIHLNLQREAQNKAKSNPVKFVENFKGGEILQMFNRISSSFHAKKEKENKPSLTHKRGQTMRELPSQFDLSIKRRANSVEKNDSEGRAFILPKKDVPEKPTKLFFFDKEPLSHQILLNKISNLSTSQVFRVAVSLSLRPPNLETLTFFVSRISPNDETMLDRVQKALSAVSNQPQNTIQSVTPLSSTNFPFFDIRYKPAEDAPVLFDKPIEMGIVPVNLDFKIPALAPNMRVVLQSFMVGVSPPTVRWPSSLLIKVNGFLVKPPGQFVSPLIDLSSFAPNSTVTVTSFSEGCQYLFVARCAKYISYKTYAKHLRFSSPAAEFFNPNECSLACPMTGEPLKNPVKGMKCMHTQAFELKEYLKRGIITGRWFCPVCGMPLPPDALIFSHMTERELFNLRSKTFNAVTSPTEELIVPPVTTQEEIFFDDDEAHNDYEFL